MKKTWIALKQVFLILVCIVIAIGIGYWVWVNTLKFKEETIIRTQQQLLTIAKAESQRIEEFINAILSSTIILSEEPIVIKYVKEGLKAKDTPEVINYSNKHLFELFMGKADSIQWLNAKGIVLGGLPFTEEMIGKDESQKPAVKNVLENHYFYTSDLFITDSGKSVFSVCSPVFEKGNFLGLTRALISLDKINDLVNTIKVGRKGYAWIISEHGTMMAHPKPEHRSIDIMAVRKEAFPDFDWSELEGIVEKMENGEEGVGIYKSAWWTEENLKIVQKLTAFSPIKIEVWHELWSIGISLSYDEIAGPIERNAMNNIVGAGFILLIFSVGGFSLYKAQRKRSELEITARSAKILRTVNYKLQKEITERKKMEEELIKAHKLESLGILAGGIAHDFNNNLQAVLSNINLAMTCVNSKDKVYQRLVEAEKAIHQAKDLSQKLLTFSKGGEPVKKAVSISELLKDTTPLALSGSIVGCEFYIADDLCSIKADKGQINQVFNNLIINAKQAMPKGGTIKISANNINVWAKDSLPLKEGRYVKITIEDQGIGISYKELQKIFDPYFTTKEKGSGLGLAITYSIIKKHDGYIVVESKIRVGTTFYIYLPVSQKEITPEPAPGEDKGARPGLIEEKDAEKALIESKRKIILMDDEGIIRLAVGEQLRGLKYEVELARNGEKAIEKYKRARETGKPFDAVIMDLTIPGGMGGKETIRELLKIDPNVKAIVASGYSDDPVISNFRKYGFSGAVTKPYEIFELSEILHKVIMEK